MIVQGFAILFSISVFVLISIFSFQIYHLQFLSLLGIPASPEGPLNVSNVTESSAVISWKSPISDGGLVILHYVIEYRIDVWGSWMKIGKAMYDETSYKLTSLTEGKHYYFRISAENEQGLSEPLCTVDPTVPRKAPGKWN